MKKQYLFTFTILTFFFFNCSKESATGAEATAATGTGGSLARFTIAANHLYLADYRNIHVYDLANPSNPVKKTSVAVDFPVETIYPYGDKLFIGSTNGMFIYSLANPSAPVKVGQALHARSCDPVVASNNTAYVTLRGGSRCGPAEDGLYIYDISNITAPVQKSLFRLSQPNGLGLKDTVVFVCRGDAGLSLVNVKNPSSPTPMYTLTGSDFKDVIPVDNILVAYVGTGLAIYDISNLNQVVKVGSVTY